MNAALSRFLSRVGLTSPFTFAEQPQLDIGAKALFVSAFGAPPPDFPIHFVARYRRTGAAAAYVHYTEHLPGVYLCGGLCVDTPIYRQMSSVERNAVKERGSLSRWLLNESIKRLRRKSAVFAYTGNVMSQRDGLASGFIRTDHPHLIVQWHGAAPAIRPDLTARIAGLGPF
jgi:hypothetical protein